MSGKKQKTGGALTGPASSGQDPEVSSGINYWRSLSDEMVLSILKMLPKKDLVTVSLINRRFRNLSKDDSLWSELTLDYEDIKQNNDSCRKLVDRCKKLSSLTITNTSQNSRRLDIMSVVIKAKQSLKSLEVDNSMRDWTLTAMKKLGSLESLTSLTLSFNSKPYAVNGYAGIEMLEKLAHLQLENLKLVIEHNKEGRHEFTNIHQTETAVAAMKRLFQQLKKLKEVDIFPDTNTSKLAFYNESVMVALVGNNPDLTVLRLKGYPPLSDRIIDVLVNSCPGLEEINISPSQSESSIQKLSSSCPNLKCLEVGWYPRIIDLKDEKFIGYIEKFKSLERLVLHGTYENITEFGVRRMLDSAEKLKHLTLAGPQMTEDLVERLKIEYPDIDLKINVGFRNLRIIVIHQI